MYFWLLKNKLYRIERINEGKETIGVDILIIIQVDRSEMFVLRQHSCQLHNRGIFKSVSLRGYSA